MTIYYTCNVKIFNSNRFYLQRPKYGKLSTEIMRAVKMYFNYI